MLRAMAIPSVALSDPTTGLPITIHAGGLSVSNRDEPARDLFLSWFFGSDTALETLTVNAANNGLWQDISLLKPETRQLVIVNGSNGGAVDYAVTVQLSRNALGVVTDDTYPALIVAAGAKAQINPIPLPVANGFDHFARLVITPTAAQAGAQLQFKAYLTGRGG